MNGARHQAVGALARARRVAPLVALGGLLAGCEGSGLLGSRLSGNWCIPASASSGELLMLSLSGDGTGLLALIPGTRPSLPLDWREDRQRLLLLLPGSQEIAYTVPIVTDAQGQPQLMVPGLGSLLDLHLQRCGTTAGATPIPPTGWPSAPPSSPASPAPGLDGNGATTLVVVLGGLLLVLIVGGITVALILRGRDDQD